MSTVPWHPAGSLALIFPIDSTIPKVDDATMDGCAPSVRPEARFPIEDVGNDEPLMVSGDE